MKTLPIIQPATGDDGAPPPFARIAVVGLGLIGGSLALACRRRWPKSLVIGVDRNDVLEVAMVRHAIDVAADDLGMLAGADLVVLAAPVETNVALLARLEAHVEGEALVTDVGSTKRVMVEAARVLPDRLQFVGGHPLAGAARAGIEHGAPEMFHGRPWFLTPVAETPAGALDRLSAFVEALGGVPRVLSPDAHDRLVAAISHLPQLVASALMTVVGDRAGEDGLALAGRGLRDTTRLASSPGHVWADVCATNADHIGEGLDALIETLATLRRDLRGD
nr:prephenate dehydrogenase/arogenate dehydrogenase family protein [Vicinamibacterales bacterium]